MVQVLKNKLGMKRVFLNGVQNPEALNKCFITVIT